MKLAIISDTHDNLENIKRFLNWALENEIEKIICLGDVAKIETIKYLTLNFPGEIFLVRGNACLYEENDLKKYKNIKYFPIIGQAEIAGLKIAFVHEPVKIKKIAEDNFDFIFHGHTHKPWLEKHGNTFIANPGNLAAQGYAATFAILDTDTGNLELRGLE